MVSFPAGTFMMGCQGAQCAETNNWSPTHSVMLSAFSIDVREVIQSEYQACIVAGACALPAGGVYSPNRTPEHPMQNASWTMANAYCTWAGKRLPTEAEWERAARGTDSRPFPLGDQEPDCTTANIGGYDPACYLTSVRVGSFATDVTADGLYDMTGNASEWVADWFAPDYYGSSPATDPTGPATGEDRVYRGGSYGFVSYYARSFYRGHTKPEISAANIGFRCAMN